MPLKTNRMDERSAAVRYAVRQYKAKKPAKEDSPGKAVKPAEDDVQVVKIKKQPIKRTCEKIKEYFR
jgi:hypothetical protein